MSELTLAWHWHCSKRNYVEAAFANQLAICLLSSFLLDFDVGPANLIVILLRLWHLNMNWSCSSGRSLSLIRRTSTGKGCGNGTTGLLSLPSTFPDAHSFRLTMILCVELLLPSNQGAWTQYSMGLWVCVCSSFPKMWNKHVMTHVYIYNIIYIYICIILYI